MSKLFREDSFLSEDGKKVLQPLHDGLMEVISDIAVREMSVAELRVLGANLAKLVGDVISEQIFARTQNTNRFNTLTDEQFYAQLKAKYGEHWMLVTLTKDELARLPRLSREEMRASIEQGILERNAAIAETPSVNINSGLRFK